MLEVIAFINSCMRALEVSQAGAELTFQHSSCLQTAFSSLLLSEGSPGPVSAQRLRDSCSGVPLGVLYPTALPPPLCISAHPSKCSNTVKDPSETFHSRGIYII